MLAANHAEEDSLSNGAKLKTQVSAAIAAAIPTSTPAAVLKRWARRVCRTAAIMAVIRGRAWRAEWEVLRRESRPRGEAQRLCRDRHRARRGERRAQLRGVTSDLDCPPRCSAPARDHRASWPRL